MNGAEKSRGTAGPEAEGSATATEIGQQPVVWRQLTGLLTDDRGDSAASDIHDFLQPVLAEPELRILLTGAGSSAFAGTLLAPALGKATKRRVDAVPTTTIVSDPGSVFAEDRPTLLVSFARSGNSPESLAACRLAEQQLSSVWQLLICCNADGDLATAYADDERARVLLMPAAAHDAGFAMTSSFTSMVLGCWFSLTGVGPAPEIVARLAAAAEHVLAAENRIAALADRDFSRVVFLGSGGLAGLAQEAALKLLELTAGSVIAYHDSPLGFRHGPKAMLTADTLVVVFRSPDDYTARYDDDIIAELTRELGPEQVVVLSTGPSAAATEPSEARSWQLRGLEGLEDGLVAVVYAVFAQVFALRRSIRLGLQPDNPFPAGEVNRVVRGVTVHPYPA